MRKFIHLGIYGFNCPAWMEGYLCPLKAGERRRGARATAQSGTSRSTDITTLQIGSEQSHSVDEDPTTPPNPHRKTCTEHGGS
jgi:hypothetical protein